VHNIVKDLSALRDVDTSTLTVMFPGCDNTLLDLFVEYVYDVKNNFDDVNSISDIVSYSDSFHAVITYLNQMNVPPNPQPNQPKDTFNGTLEDTQEDLPEPPKETFPDSHPLMFNEVTNNYETNIHENNSVETIYTYPRTSVDASAKQDKEHQATITSLSEEEYKKVPRFKKTNFAQCVLCGMYRDISITLIKDGTMQCWDCYFWINYDVGQRENCDGVDGPCIVDYVLKCSKYHTTPCKRQTEAGGCFLCDYNNGFDIPKIKNKYKLHKKEEYTFEYDDNVTYVDSFAVTIAAT